MSAPARIGSYPIERELGRGGMGIVYLGRDMRLDRPVAIKVLPETFAHDPERLARFEREARLLASLSHPNIAGIYGVEESQGQRFLVLEYVEGETLAQRIGHGALPVDDAVDVCRQIAAALEAAHESGVIHRDLKPGNVKLTPAGEIKVLDFGLARGTAGMSSSGGDLSASPTMPITAMTSAGVILGTAPYMSPEQARGKVVDRRTDIWSFGCVLYECLAGRAAFAGETVSDVIAQILQGAPDWKALPPNLPPALRELAERCLTKDPKRRLRDIGEARLLLEGGSASLVSASGVTAARAAAPAGKAPWLPWALAALFATAAATSTVLWRKSATEIAPVQRVTVSAPPTSYAPRDVANIDLSADGSVIVVSAGDSAGGGFLWVRTLDAVEGRALPGTEDGALPFWSPDGRHVGFSTQDKLKKVDLQGGTPEILCPIASYGRGGSWGSQGVIVFSGGAEGPIYKVSENGGNPEPVTKLDSTETGHRFPRFLPDGRHFLYAALPAREYQFTIYVGSTDSPVREKLMVADGTPIYADPGWLIFGRNGRVVAQRFDAGRRRLSGEPLPLRDEPTRTQFLGCPSTITGRSGALGYFTRHPAMARIYWASDARILEEIPVPPASYESVCPSPDGRRAVVARSTAPTSSDLWILDIARRSLTRLTHGPGRVDRPIWSPDGRRVAFSSDRNGRWDLFEKVVDAPTPERPLLTSGSLIKYPCAYTPDGNRLIFEQLMERSGWDIYELSLSDSTAKPLLATSYDEQNAALTRDGRWLAFGSNESGRTEIYVQSFPQPTQRFTASTTGGVFPRWRADGRRLVFLSGTELATVDVREAGGELSFEPANRFPVPENVVTGMYLEDFSRWIVIQRVTDKRQNDDITLVLNWRTELKRH